MNARPAAGAGEDRWLPFRMLGLGGRVRRYFGALGNKHMQTRWAQTCELTEIAAQLEDPGLLSGVEARAAGEACVGPQIAAGHLAARLWRINWWRVVEAGGGGPRWSCRGTLSGGWRGWRHYVSVTSFALSKATFFRQPWRPAGWLAMPTGRPRPQGRALNSARAQRSLLKDASSFKISFRIFSC